MVVVTGASAPAVELELADLSVICVQNDGWAAGMGHSLRLGTAALLAATPSIPAAVVLLCDQPYLTGEVVKRLLIAWENGDQPIAACRLRRDAWAPLLLHPSDSRKF